MSCKETLAFYHREADYWNKDENVKDFDTGSAVDSWILPTFSALRDQDFTVELTSEVPKDGVLFVSSYDLQMLTVQSDVLVVCILADGYPSPRSDLTIVQNWEQAPFCKPALCIPHWPQPNLVPRDASRGERVENVAFLGAKVNLLPSLREHSFQQKLKDELDINMLFPSKERWSDYSEIDVVLGIRPETGSCWSGAKPASKLVNSWLAGVPAIMTPESAILNAGIPGCDYFVATSSKSVFDILGRLKRHPELYSAMTVRAKEKSRNYSVEAISEQWGMIVRNVITPMALGEITQIPSRGLRSFFNRLVYRLKRRQTF